MLFSKNKQKLFSEIDFCMIYLFEYTSIEWELYESFCYIVESKNGLVIRLYRGSRFRYGLIDCELLYTYSRVYSFQ